MNHEGKNEILQILSASHEILLAEMASLMTHTGSVLMIVNINGTLILLAVSAHPSCMIPFVTLDTRAQWKTVWIMISWLLQKPTDLDLHCFQHRYEP